MTQKELPLHKLIEEERIEKTRDILEEAHVPEQNFGLAAFMLGIAEQECENHNIDLENLEEQSTTGEVEVVAKMMKPIITRGFVQSSATEFCGTWPLNQDTGKIAAFRTYYTNDNTNPVKAEDGAILVLADASAFSIGDAIENSGSTAKGTVRYAESGNNAIHVEMTLGTFAVGESVDNATPYAGAETTVSAVLPPEIGPTVFEGYFSFSTLSASEAATDAIREAEFGIELFSVEALPKKVRLRSTKEVGLRLKDYYGYNMDNVTNAVGTYALKMQLNREAFEQIYDAGRTGGLSNWNYNTSSDGRWEEEKIKTFNNYLMIKSAEGLDANKIDMLNYAVSDTLTFAFERSYGYMDASSLPNGQSMPMKNAFVGIANGFFRWYVNPWLRHRNVTLGMKDFSGAADAETRASVFFHPYKAIDIATTISESSGQPIKYFFSMYGFTLHPFRNTSGLNDFARSIDVLNLPGTV